jgi:hypothetical protein
MYTAAVLLPDSAQKLKNFVESQNKMELLGFEYKTPSGQSLPHHMTINLELFDPDLNPPELLGQEAELHVDTIWMSEEIGVCAAEVSIAKSGTTEVRSSNKRKHITICLKPPAKPFHSNKMLEGDKKGLILIEPLVLKAIIQEVE